MTIRPDYIPAPGEDPGELGPNEFTAGSVLSLNCTVQGNSSTLTYDWSVTGDPDTTGCSGCVVIPDYTTSESVLRLAQPSFASYHSGNYTCTVSESGRPDSRNNDTFTVTVVGEMIYLHVMSYVVMYTPGAGVYATQRTLTNEFVPCPIANNGLIVSASDGLRLECISNSSQPGVGNIIGRNGNTLPFSSYLVLRLNNPFRRPGVLRLQTRTAALITTSDQGIYTCTIPDSNNNQFVINFGLYPNGFMGELSCVSL